MQRWPPFHEPALRQERDRCIHIHTWDPCGKNFNSRRCCRVPATARYSRQRELCAHPLCFPVSLWLPVDSEYLFLNFPLSFPSLPPSHSPSVAGLDPPDGSNRSICCGRGKCVAVMTRIIGTTQRKCPAWPGLAPAALTHTLVRSWLVLQVPGCDIFSSFPNTNPDCGPGGAGSHLQKVRDPGWCTRAPGT